MGIKVLWPASGGIAVGDVVGGVDEVSNTNVYKVCCALGVVQW